MKKVITNVATFPPLRAKHPVHRLRSSEDSRQHSGIEKIYHPVIKSTENINRLQYQAGSKISNWIDWAEVLLHVRATYFREYMKINYTVQASVHLA